MSGRNIRRSLWLVVLVAASLALVTMLTSAWGSAPRPQGESITIQTERNFAGRDVTTVGDGQFVISWKDGTKKDEPIVVQRFDRTGAPLSPPSQVNQSDGYARTAVAGSSEGPFVVVWVGPDGAESIPRGRRYDKEGNPAGDEFLVGDTAGSELGVDMRTDGSFVIVWSNTWQLGEAPQEVYAQRFDAQGTAEGPTEFVVAYHDDDTASYYQSNTSVAVSDSGNFVVAYDENATVGSSSSWREVSDVHARIYDRGGEALTGEQDIGRGDPDTAAEPRIGVDGFGGYTVVWDDADYYDNYLDRQQLDPEGNKLGDRERLTEQYWEDRYEGKDVAAMAHGDHVVVWAGGPEDGSGPDNQILLEAYDRIGQRLSDRVTLADEGTTPRLDVAEWGQIVAVWGSETSSLGYARQFCLDPPLVLTQTDGTQASLRLLHLQDATEHGSVGLDPSDAGVPFVSPLSDPKSREALVARQGPDGRTVRLRRVLTGSATSATAARIGPDARLVEGVGPIHVAGGGQVLLASENPIAGDVRVRWLGAETLTEEGTTILGPSRRLAPRVPPIELEQAGRALLATESAGDGTGTVHVLDVPSMSVVHEIVLDAGEGFVRAVPLVGVGGDRALVASEESSGGWVRLRLLDAMTGDVLWRHDFGARETLAPGVGVVLSQDASAAVLATRGEPGAVRVVDIDSGDLRGTTDLPTDELLVEGVSIALTPDGERAVVATREADGGSARLRVVELANGTSSAPVFLSGDLVPGIAPLAIPHVEEAAIGTQSDVATVYWVMLDDARVKRRYSSDPGEELVRGVGLVVTPDTGRLSWATDGPSGVRVRVDTDDGVAVADLGTSQSLVADVGLSLSRCGWQVLALTDGTPGRLSFVDARTGAINGAVDLLAGEYPLRGVPPDLPPSAVFDDCNRNGVLDADDIADGTSDDCDGNGIPDECQPDCNGNDVADSCDAGTTSPDCDGDGVPDECQPDCNGNGIADPCDISGGTSEDCTGNGIPDECEDDCNDNGLVDSCEIQMGAALDCNDDGIPDDCQQDLDTDGDGELDCLDNCPFVPNPSQLDTDLDGAGDACDTDDDGDGIENVRDNCLTAANEDQGNRDADALGDACDNCDRHFNPDQIDDDSDARGAACDCEDADPAVWAAPSEARQLSLAHDAGTGETTLNWTAPEEAGAESIWYDVLRADDPNGFGAAGTCVESDDDDTSATDADAPLAGACFHYLVRAENACPNGEGDLGQSSAGDPRAGRSCP